MCIRDSSNSNHPLLKRLMMEAPGTYNHSILVGNLAEAAADAIGANTLLVRVASYYHDIGKLKRPHFYIENQRPGENPHDKLQPGLSAMIITSHTTDGSKMLREEHFPEEIIDIVEQHHGNSVLKYFYNKAKEQALDPDEVKVADYRYKGRRPQTKEAALVMLDVYKRQRKECLFCRIVDGEIPSTIVWEDEDLLAFNDINPVAPTHILLIPRKHLSCLNDMTEDDIRIIGKINYVASLLAKQMGIAGDGWRLVSNCGKNSGQEVPHLHYHLIGGKFLGPFSDR